MGFILEEDHELMRKMVRGFAEKELAPYAREMDITGEFPPDILKKCAELNLMGLSVAEKYGGAGSDLLTRVIAIEEVARANTAVAFVIGLQGPAECLEYAGTEEQKQKYLVPLATGEKLSGFGLTEPGSGSDATAMLTTAVRDGDSWVLNGSKCFISNGGVADIYVIFAKTPQEEGVRGPSAFILEKGTPGFIFGKKEEKMGFSASTTRELIFQDCRIPAENLLGKVGKGMHLAMYSFDQGRICCAAMAIGLTQASLEAAVTYAKQRKTFGKPIAEHQQIAFYIAEMATKLEAARSLTYRAASLYDAGQPVGKESAMAKYYATEVAVWCTDKCMRIHGGYGYMKEYPIERYLREARLLIIADGTTEIQKVVVSRMVLG
ncbi:acyl-CoA dehydrogenase family protein [Sporomusa sp.]|uniref:acyl-CoA dehydrogenase family protein n=1 Tax=Sporomusa sp. TaxID=2078658 RepID=UPI002BB108EF|nr:acyl-CoA dehydrogenase family protein [Sporomusa sp.]HWR06243.1 acyl-CoA dehydrogenase family protein [Sporomusa sp.]